jgi:predicted transcriptional regulator
VEKIKARRAEGKSNREIADELVDVSEATVRRILKEETFDFTKE